MTRSTYRHEDTPPPGGSVEGVITTVTNPPPDRAGVEESSGRVPKAWEVTDYFSVSGDEEAGGTGTIKRSPAATQKVNHGKNTSACGSKDMQQHSHTVPPTRDLSGSSGKKANVEVNPTSNGTGGNTTKDGSSIGSVNVNGKTVNTIKEGESGCWERRTGVGAPMQQGAAEKIVNHGNVMKARQSGRIANQGSVNNASDANNLISTTRNLKSVEDKNPSELSERLPTTVMGSTEKAQSAEGHADVKLTKSVTGSKVPGNEEPHKDEVEIKLSANQRSGDSESISKKAGVNFQEPSLIINRGKRQESDHETPKNSNKNKDIANTAISRNQQRGSNGEKESSKDSFHVHNKQDISLTKPRTLASNMNNQKFKNTPAGSVESTRMNRTALNDISLNNPTGKGKQRYDMKVPKKNPASSPSINSQRSKPDSNKLILKNQKAQEMEKKSIIKRVLWFNNSKPEGTDQTKDDYKSVSKSSPGMAAKSMRDDQRPATEAPVRGNSPTVKIKGQVSPLPQKKTQGPVHEKQMQKKEKRPLPTYHKTAADAPQEVVAAKKSVSGKEPEAVRTCSSPRQMPRRIVDGGSDGKERAEGQSPGTAQRSKVAVKNAEVEVDSVAVPNAAMARPDRKHKNTAHHKPEVAAIKRAASNADLRKSARTPPTPRASNGGSARSLPPTPIVDRKWTTAATAATASPRTAKLREGTPGLTSSGAPSAAVSISSILVKAVGEDVYRTATRVTVKNASALGLMFGAQNFDVIKFATYRTSCKLRFIQKKTNMFLVDIWNVIEAFRENGLNSFEPHAEVNVARLESLLTSVYYHLNKRLPTTSQINADYSLGLLINWLLSAYDPEGNGRIRVLSIKTALSTLCAGKLMDKLRYVFTQISDSNGYMVRTKLDEYLREVLTLPTAVFEGPSFGYNETAARACFGDKTKVNVNDFLDTLMSDPGPQCLMWLPILHRMAQVENVFHPVQCEGCHRESFMGFRYKCQRCYNYHLCQDCFWRGRISGNHSNDHEVKEYSSYKSPAKQFGHSLRKSFRCVPASRSNHRIPRFPEQEQTLDLSHIVPATPVPSHNGFPETHSRSHSIDMSSLDTSSATQSPSKMHGSIDSSRIDDEHRLIARYAARLAADANNASRSPTELNFSLDSNQAQRELIAQLEEKNRDILREIQRLRIEQEAHAKASPDPHQPRNPTLLAELRLLRQRRDELEGRMSALQESRRELMVQLEGLMKLLKSQGSPRSTPNSSPRSRTAHSPPSQMVRGSTPSTPGDALVGVGGDVRQAFGGQQGSTASVHSLRNDLLVAADSVTNAMSSLVKELNSEASASDDEEEDDEDDNNGFGRPPSHGQGTIDEMVAWREEMQQRLQQESEFIAQLRARRDSGQKDSNIRYIPGADGTGAYITDGDDSYVKTDDESYMRTDEEDAELYDRDPKELFLQPRYLTDEESYLETDQESYIRTDDEDGGGTDWEETMRRWVNR